jgi:hypothetical protein
VNIAFFFRRLGEEGSARQYWVWYFWTGARTVESLGLEAVLRCDGETPGGSPAAGRKACPAMRCAQAFSDQPSAFSF